MSCRSRSAALNGFFVPTPSRRWGDQIVVSETRPAPRSITASRISAEVMFGVVGELHAAGH
jgi:hypothetical protein